jgi:hypothetical protein
MPYRADYLPERQTWAVVTTATLLDGSVVAIETPRGLVEGQLIITTCGSEEEARRLAALYNSRGKERT